MPRREGRHEPAAALVGRLRRGLQGDRRRDQRPFAIRIFTTESPERRERYDSISAYLKAEKLACLVDFEYRDNSVRSAGDGKWYPLILMDWVQGDTLFDWVRARCSAGDREALARGRRAMDGRWCGSWPTPQIAHGDLQHANVMVNDGRRAEAGRLRRDVRARPGRAAEPGDRRRALPASRPQRVDAAVAGPGQLLGPGDLRGAAGAGGRPGLWMKYVEQPGHDKLLFRSDDLRPRPARALCHDLLNSPDREVRELVERLFRPAAAPRRRCRRWPS